MNLVEGVKVLLIWLRGQTQYEFGECVKPSMNLVEVAKPSTILFEGMKHRISLIEGVKPSINLVQWVKYHIDLVEGAKPSITCQRERFWEIQNSPLQKVSKIYKLFNNGTSFKSLAQISQEQQNYKLELCAFKSKIPHKKCL